MRIEAYSQVQQAYKTRKTEKAYKPASAGSTDQLQISSMGKEILTAKSAVQASPDIREELTAPIKERIQKGTYEVTPDSFAKKLLDAYQAR
jgi:negative regulator of flagellin synthesis FlgM